MDNQAQSQIDFIVKRFQEAISKTDACTKQVQEVMSLYSSIKSELDSLAYCDSDLQSQILNLASKSSSGFVLSNKQLENLTLGINTIENNHNSLKNEVSNLKLLVPDLQIQLNAVSQKILNLCEKDNLQLLIKDLNEHKENTKIHNDKVNQHNISLVASYDKLKRFAEALSEELTSLKENVRSMSMFMGSIKEEVVLHKQTTLAMMQNMKDGLLRLIDEKIAAIPQPEEKPIINDDSYIIDQIQNISKEIKTINSSLKINEAKYVVLEKKIAQLQTQG